MARPATLYYCATSAFVPHDFIQISADFCWDPLGLSRPRFWDLDAVMWTEPSTGFAAPARELIALCHDMFDIFLEGVPRAEFSDLTHHIATAILPAGSFGNTSRGGRGLQSLSCRQPMTGWLRAKTLFP